MNHFRMRNSRPTFYFENASMWLPESEANGLFVGSLDLPTSSMRLGFCHLRVPWSDRLWRKLSERVVYGSRERASYRYRSIFTVACFQPVATWPRFLEQCCATAPCVQRLRY